MDTDREINQLCRLYDIIHKRCPEMPQKISKIDQKFQQNYRIKSTYKNQKVFSVPMTNNMLKKRS